MDSKKDFPPTTQSSYEVEEGFIQKYETVQGGRFAGLREWAKKISLETGGIQRVTDEERQHNTTKVWNACTFW
jgi:hypothetical protein